MALARVVSFDGVTKERIEELRQEISEGEQPEGLSPTEIVVLHEPDAERSLVIIFFDSEEDYESGDKVLGEMPSGDTPGSRGSVTRYDVAIRHSP
jgi:hypothetical protein